MANTHLINGPLDINIIAGRLHGFGTDTGAGGHSVFLGQVRADQVKGSIVEAIEYSAYEKMVNAEAGRIISEIKSGFPDVRSVEILHSTGMVKAGELSLFVAVSAGHRLQAIEACRVTVELIKERLPVWKKEILRDGSREWK